MKICWLLAVLCLLAPSAWPAETVGEWGDPARLEFEGVTAFRPEEIRNGLLRHPDFLLASHSAAPMERYLKAVREMIRLGYLDDGFASPKVQVQRDDQQHIRVQVEEGPRFRCGRVELRGAREIPVAAFVKRLTEPMQVTEGKQSAVGGPARAALERTEGPIWKKGDYASFTEMTKVRLTAATSNVLDELGWMFAKTKVHVEPIASRGEADLIVEVLEEGPVGKVGSVTVQGNQRNSVESIIKAAGLTVGMALNRQVLLQAEEKLWDAARFLQHRVGARLPEDSNVAEVVIEVREYEKARPLDEAWSPEEAAALKGCTWLTQFPSRGDDLSFTLSKPTASSETIELVFSGDGILVLVKKSAASSPAEFLQAGWIAQQESSLMSLTQKKKIVFDGSRVQFMTSLHILPNEDPTAEQPFNMNVSGGVKSLADDEEPGAPAVDLRLAPVAFLDLVKREGAKVRLENGELLVESDAARLKVEASTGRVLELIVFLDEARLELRLEKGTFRRHQSELRKYMADLPQVNKPGRGITALAQYVFDEIALGPYLNDPAKKPYLGPPEQRQAAAAAWDKIIQSDVLEPLDQLVARLGVANTNTFGVPLDTRTLGGPLGAMVAAVAAYVFQLSNELFPKESWPWTVARETVFVLMGRGEYTGEELDRLYGTHEMGPLGYLAVAKLLSLAGQKQASLFAIGGLTRLRTDDFHQDWRLLVEGLPALRQSSMRAADALAGLTAAEIEALSAGLDDKETFADLVKMLRESKDESPDIRLKQAGDLIWERLLKEPVRVELRKLTK